MNLDTDADRQAFLAKAGRTLLSSLDYRATLQRLADLAVPVFGDWCALDMVREDGGYARLAVAHSEPEKVKLAHELWERYPSQPTDEVGLASVIRTGVAELVSEIPDALLEASARDADHLRILRSLGLRSYMMVPLTARGGVLGVLTLVHAESGRRYADADLAFAQEFAKLAAIATDNARLYESESTARARAEASEESFRTFIDNLPLLAWTALPDGHIDFYNRRWYEYTGTSFEQMQGWGWESVHDPAMLATVREQWHTSLATGESFELEFTLMGADKVPRWFLTRASPLRDKTGTILRWFGTNTNIDDIRAARALAEEMASQSHDMAKRFVELRARVTELEHENESLRR